MAEETHGDARVYDCVVIGAGLAGLQAARRLHDGGLSGASRAPRGDPPEVSHRRPPPPTRAVACRRPARPRPILHAPLVLTLSLILIAVVVLEAGDHLGGRVSQVEGLAPWPVQLGPEFIHGDERNLVKDLADARGWTYRTLEWPDRYYFAPGHADGGSTTAPGGSSSTGLVDASIADESDADVAECHRLFADLPGVPAETANAAEDFSAEEWLRDVVKASPRVIALAESLYANDFGCSLRTMGMRETAIEQKCWCYGEKYLVLNRSLRDVAEALGEGVETRLRARVAEVTRERNLSETGEEGPLLTVRGERSNLGESPEGVNGAPFELRARRCVFAAPLGALGDDGGSEDDDEEEYSEEKASSSPKPSSSSPKPSSSSPKPSLTDASIVSAVRFVPALSASKRAASRVVRTSNAVKILLAFDEPFWPAGLWDVVCVGAFLPELWILDFPPKPTGPCADAAVARRTKAVVTFFACGDLADALTREMTREEVLERALAQLDEMFGEHAGEPAPSRARLVDWRFHDWASAPHVGGAYTHPSVGAAGAREKLAASEWGGALVFAGEATHAGVNPCMQAAMETGIRAAEEILARVSIDDRGREIPTRSR